MTKSFFKDLPKEFPNCLTVKELKDLVKDWPEVHALSGEPMEVWIDNPNGTSSPVIAVWPLNYSKSDESGKESADIMLVPPRGQFA